MLFFSIFYRDFLLLKSKSRSVTPSPSPSPRNSYTRPQALAVQRTRGVVQKCNSNGNNAGTAQTQQKPNTLHPLGRSTYLLIVKFVL